MGGRFPVKILQTGWSRGMQQRQFENGKEIYYYEIEDGKVHVARFEGHASRIELPPQIEGCPVAVIERKAFLSRKNLHAVALPDTTEEIGDWAFAYCDNLTEVSLPGRNVRFGRAVFKNCGKLKRIVVRQQVHPTELPARQQNHNPELPARQQSHPPELPVRQHNQAPELPAKQRNHASELSASQQNQTLMLPAGYQEQVPELLAAAVTMLDAYYLLDLPAAGSQEWLGKWDAKLTSVIHTADQEGYISQSVYGEEDYIGTDLEEYVSARRKEKVRLAFVRLLHPHALQPALKEELERYLRSLTKGREGEEAWQVLREEHGDDREYYSLFAEISCVTEENLEGILADIGENYPEMKAFFLTLDKSGEGDFFADLEL